MVDVVPQAQWDYEIAAGDERPADWFWHGFVGKGNILAEWPEDFDKPSPVTLYRWLKHALDNNMISCEGTAAKAHC
jgi:hypothetical protein